LKAYAQGNEARAIGNPDEALKFYLRAVELDPNFAMAYARLSVFYGNQSQIDLARQYADKAFALRDRVSEHEKFYISEKYYNYVTGDEDKAVELLQAWTAQYPNDYIPFNNLALHYQIKGQYEEARKAATRSLELNPTQISARDNLFGSFLGLERFDEAEQAVNDIAKVNPDAPAIHFNRYLLAFLRGDQSAMDSSIAAIKGKSPEPDALMAVAAVDMYYGKLSEGERFVAKASELFKAQQRTENLGQSVAQLAAKQAVLGKCQQAKQNVSSSLALSRNRFSLGTAGIAAALCNDVPQAQSLLDEQLKLYPKDTGVVFGVAPTMKALLELNRQNGAAAVQALEPMRNYDLGIIVGVSGICLRGQAYLQQRMGKEAAAEFEKVISHRGVDPFALEHPLAHLGLARASVLTGDTAKARKEYQDFLALWKDADQDLALLAQAKKEYEALK
jgi:tetratricopeptide (TPR) repeat protein